MVSSANTSGKSTLVALYAGLMLLFMMAGHTVLETARDSLFLSRLPISQLPFTYIAIAVAALLASELNAHLRPRGGQRRMLAMSLAIGALGCFGFLKLFGSGASWVPHALYVWIAVTATLAVAQFWIVLSELFTVIEAKRLYSSISAGGLVGAMSGGALARFASARFGDLSLLGIGGSLLLLAAVLAGAGARAERCRDVRIEPMPNVAPSEAGSSEARRDLRSERYLRRLLLLTLLATITATLVDYLFKAQVVRSVPAAQLGRFFGSLNTWLNAAALVVQFLLAPRLLGGLGVGGALPILPAGLGVLAMLALWVPSLGFVLALRAVDGSLRFSLYRSAVEVLFLPLPTLARARWKTLIDALGQRGGQALGSLLILGCLALDLPIRPMLLLLAASAAGWLSVALGMEKRYLSLFRAKIRAGAIETRAEVPELDLRALESLVTALSSDSDEEVLATIDLLIDYDRVHLIPSLLLYHPSRAVVIRTLEVLADSGRDDFAGAARRLLARDDDEIHAAAMLALARQMAPDELRAELSGRLPVAARAAALTALVARRLDHDGACVRELARGCQPDADPALRLASARAFRLLNDRFCFEFLPRLLLSASDELEQEVARVMLALPDPVHIPYLLSMLDSRRARQTARDALVAIGPSALAALADAFERTDLPRQLRAHLPRSISRFGSAEAADILLARLERETEGWVRFKIIRGLGQLRPFMQDAARLRRAFAYARKNLTRAIHFMSLRLRGARDLSSDPRLATPGGELLIAALLDKERHAIDRAVRLVGLAHSADIIHDIRRALAGPDRRRRADSIEVLSHEAPADISRALGALLDDLPEELRLQRAAEVLREPLAAGSYEARLEQLLNDSSEALRAVAAYHIGELGLTRLARSTASAGRRSSDLGSEVFERVTRLLGEAGFGEPGLTPSAAGLVERTRS